jgi:MraZ protein
MSHLVGEYECKLDAKGRFLFPAGLRKQIDPSANEAFMINRGFENCLSIYPMNEWDKISARLKKLNLFKAENRTFFRLFHNGANAASLDNAGRILIPRSLMPYADLKKEIILTAYGDRIEVWDKKTYEKMLSNNSDSFAELADKVMGSDDTE